MSTDPRFVKLDRDLQSQANPGFIKDRNFRFVAVNEAFLTASGFRESDLIGRTSSEVFDARTWSDKRVEADRAIRRIYVFGGHDHITLMFDDGPTLFELRREGTLSEGAWIVAEAPVLLSRMPAAPDSVPSSVPLTPDESRIAADDLSMMVECMQVAAILFDRDLKAIAISRAFYAVWGLNEDDFSIGDGFEKQVDISRGMRSETYDDETWNAHVRSVVNSVSRFDVPERDIEMRDGRILHTAGVTFSGGRQLISYELVSAKGHNVKSVESLRKRAHKSDTILRNILDNLPASVVVYDKDNNFVLDNDVRRTLHPLYDEVMQPESTLSDFVDFMHRNRLCEDSDSKSIDAIHDTDPEGWKAARLAQFDEPYRTFESYTENETWLQVTDRRLKDGTLIRLWTDITELKAREVEQDRLNTVAQDALTTLNAAIETMPQGVVIWDSQDRFIAANHVFRDQFPGIEIVPGQSPYKLFHDFICTGAIPGCKGSEEDWAREKTAEWQKAIGVIEMFETHDGRWIKREDIRSSEGLRVGIRNDITALKRREIELEAAREKAETAEHFKSEFLANMSHEIRTPMNGILGMAEILGKTELDSRQKMFSDIIVSSGNALLTIINDILDFSKIEAGQLVIVPASFSIARAIEDVAALMATALMEKDIEMIVRIEPGLPDTLVGDVGRMRQILTNLMGNAVKFTEQGHVFVDVSGTVRPATPEEGSEPGARIVSLHCTVTDTGIGIPEDKIDDVFGSFRQVDGSSTRCHEGTGLGLAISLRLVELMGGEIGCTSILGAGSKFWFTVDLPVDEVVRAKPLPPVDVTAANVLVVDDNEVNRSILVEQLESWRFRHQAVASGAEAMALLRERATTGQNIDAVILDYHMPEMNGAGVARLIRDDPALAGLPIIMLTSIDIQVNGEAFKALEIDGYLVKPARSAQLLETIVDVLQKSGYSPGRGKVRRLALAEAESERAAREAHEPAPAAEPVRPLEIASDRAWNRMAEGAILDVLVAEDNDINQFVVSQVLESAGYSFEMVENGALAIDAAFDLMPRVILMDVSMPVMNGHEATRRIRERERGTDSHFIIIGTTAHALAEDREKCISAGMDDYIAKPISPAVLQKKIAEWMERDAPDAVIRRA